MAFVPALVSENHVALFPEIHHFVPEICNQITVYNLKNLHKKIGLDIIPWDSFPTNHPNPNHVNGLQTLLQR